MVYSKDDPMGAMKANNMEDFSPEKSALDLGGERLQTQFSRYDSDEWELVTPLHNVVVLRYADVSENGERNEGGILLLEGSKEKNPWRQAEVLAAGPDCTCVKKGEFVMLAAHKGIPVSDIWIDGYGKVENAVITDEKSIHSVIRKRKA